MTHLLRQLRRNSDGVTVVEFAAIAPALVLVLMGLFDIGFTLYANVMLQGALQEGARSSTVEGAANSLTTIDNAIATQVGQAVPGAQFVFARKAYASFSDVKIPEDFTDSNANGVCDDGEPFEDANGSDSWDRDRGVNGLGGARDAVLYTVTMTYQRPLPMASLLGFSDTVTSAASTVLRNQPYDLQKSVAKPGNCT